MTTTAVPKYVKKNASIVVHRSGIDMWGLYVEAVRFDGVGNPCTVGRFFVAGNQVCYYERPISSIRTVWRCDTYLSPEAAQAEFQKRIERGGWVLRGTPVLTQLKAPDKVEIDNGKMPGARYIAVLAHEDAFGQCTIDSPVNPAPIDESVIEWTKEA